MIAMAMTAQPRLVVADEPTTALDVTVQAQILELFRRFRDEQGSAFFFITHDLAVAAAIADRIVVLYAGRMVEIGEVDDVHERPAHPYTAALLSARFGLDVDKSRQLPTLRGESAQPAADEAGCPFAPRCLLQVPDCLGQVPRLAPVAQHGGLAACIRTELVNSRALGSHRGRLAESGQTDPASLARG